MGFRYSSESPTLFEGADDAGDPMGISVKALAERWIGLSSGETVQSPEVLFQLAWRQVALRSGGEERVRLPREIMFLGGAPGAGKAGVSPSKARRWW